MALRNILILRKPPLRDAACGGSSGQGGCLEGRAALIQPAVNSCTRSFAGVRVARSVLAALVAALALIGAGARPAAAQDATPTTGGLQILVTSYLWLSGINATIDTPIPSAQSVTADVSSIDLLSHLSAVPFMGSLEIRDGPLGILGDALHVPIGTGITTRRSLFSGGHAELIANAGTGLFLYRALEQPTQYGDLGVGFRAWTFTANLTLNPGT